MIPYDKLTPEIVASECEAAMRACDEGIAAIVATPTAKRTFDNTFVALESAMDHIARRRGAYAFMAYVSADDALRETAREWDEKLSKYAVAARLPRGPLRRREGVRRDARGGRR